MTKEIYISSTPHETRLVLVEDDRLAEIYYERENEYTLAGSIYKGRVTRVLPGMQSAFVDIGLERDAFLYVTDFVEENEEGVEYVALPQGQGQREDNRGSARNDALNEGRGGPRSQVQPATSGPKSPEGGADNLPEPEQGTRRWRGRRGRRRSNDRSGSDRNNERAAVAPAATLVPEETNPSGTEALPGPGQGARASERTSYEHPAFERQRSGSQRGPQEVPYGPSRETSNASPLVLPGESLSKYRRDDAPPPAASTVPASTHAPAAPAPTYRPSTLVEAPLAWDGGQTLPGESLSRYRNAPPAKVAGAPAIAPVAETLPQATETVTGPTEEVSTGSQEVVSTAPGTVAGTAVSIAGPVTVPVAVPVDAPDPAPAIVSANTASPVAEAEDVPMSAAPSVTATAETLTTEAAEYEPTEASASYLVDPNTPSAFRLGGTSAPEAIQPGTPAAPPATTPENAPPASPAATRGPADMEEVKIVEENTDAEGDANDEESISYDDADENDSDATLHAFAPGAGLLEEELMDEEEEEAPASHALLNENEFDDLVEETLDVQMDGGLLGDMVRDAHIEERIRFKEDQSGQVVEEEETDEEVLGEEEDELTPEAPLDGADDAIAVETTEGAGQEGVVQPTRPRTGFLGRGRQSGRRRSGGQNGGRGRRATAQTTNMPAITELLKAGQEILVQIAKEPIARKGARITSHIALPGRFLVFMPTVNHVGVSRKISSDEERQRLKRILISEKGEVGGGFIVRTAAATASEEDLRADIRFLLNLWADIRQHSESSKPPALIYHDLSLVERVLRDQVSENFSTIWVDTESDYERVLRFLERFQPSLLRHVKLYTKETPLFEQFGIQEEIDKALSSKVWLKSGGSIVINQTEALVAIDVNTGKYVGKTARLEDTILKTNLDAIPEIVRQVRLRDLGGIIIIDFIDMDERRNRQKVMQALEEELHSDRAPSKVLQFNDFGLVAITRKRVKQSLERTLSTPCAVCSGTGMVKSPVTVCNEIYMELRKMYRHLERGDILLRVHPDVVQQLKLNNARWIGEMEELSGKTIIVKSDPGLHPEQFDIQ